ncbi:MAG: DUF2723 domain-containing protein [Bacteroidota bacterium]
MKNSFSLLNNLFGWLVFGVAAVVYILTIEPTASFWDCGEFISVAYKLQVPHAPGAPFFLLAGRLFSMLASDTTQVAFWVNLLSAMCSAITIAFLFWTITLLGAKMFGRKPKEMLGWQKVVVWAGAAIGALAYTFSDSFWFSAVEAEVYAMSSLFTALVVWAILKWDVVEDPREENRWMIFIAYLIGLSIGIHLLNLLAIPVLGLVYYFKKYKEHTLLGALLALGGSLVVLLLIMKGVVGEMGVWPRRIFLLVIAVGYLIYYNVRNENVDTRTNIRVFLLALGVSLLALTGVITGLPSLFGQSELLFVNDMGLPFGSGIIAFGLVWLGLIVYFIRYTQKKGLAVANTAMLSYAFILIGYASYGIIVVRSNDNPPIDENNPENIMSFISYLKREQYGQSPLFYGAQYTAKYDAIENGAPIYVKAGNRYKIADYRQKLVYNDKGDEVFMPRMWFNGHAQLYERIVGLPRGAQPSLGDHLEYMIKWQFGHYYWRYFLWNFAGRFSDVQDDPAMLPWNAGGDEVPEMFRENPGRNNFFLLPLILGLIGLIFQLQIDPRRFSVVGILFVMTGIAIIVYLNSWAQEPRERDYAYVGSYYAFAIWIGFGAMAIGYLLKQYVFGGVEKAVTEPISAGESKENTPLPGLIAFVIALAVPFIMASEGWDDHDRSGRYFQMEGARNLLASCPDDAILVSGGDNDTFPLWYLQEVEGFRTDVRVIVYTYFNTDWNLEQMSRQAYDSDPFPFTLSEDHWAPGSPFNTVYYQEKPNFTNDPRFANGLPLKEYIKLVREKNPGIQLTVNANTTIATIPMNKLWLPQNAQENASRGLIPNNLMAYAANGLTFTMKDQVIKRADLMLLDMISNNNWERPICFTRAGIASLDLEIRPHLVQEGLAYRLTPIRNPNYNAVNLFNNDRAYDLVMNQFSFKGLDDPDVYHNTEDYVNRTISEHRTLFIRLAQSLLIEGRTEDARAVMLRCLEVIPDESVFFDHQFVEAVGLLYQLGEDDLAKEVGDKIVNRICENIPYLAEKQMYDHQWFGYPTQTAMRILMNNLQRLNKTEVLNEYNAKYQEAINYANSL